MTTKLFLILLVVLVTNDNVFAEQTLTREYIDDFSRNEVPVSTTTRRIKGIMAYEPGSKVNVSGLFVMIPSSNYSNLCLTLTSKDGTYTLWAYYDVSRAAPGIYYIALSGNSKIDKNLRRYQGKHGDELIAYSSLSNQTCPSKEEPIPSDKLYEAVIAGWNPPVRDKEVSFYLNVTEYDSIELTDGNNDELTSTEHIISENSTSYRVRYNIRVPDKTKKINFFRSQGFKKEEKIVLPINFD